MTLKKILVGTVTGALLLTAAPIVVDNVVDVSIAEAAKGGAKISMPKSAPKVNINKAPSKSNSSNSSANESKSVSGGGKEYKPSKSAKDLNNTAPDVKSNTAASKTNTNPTANTGSAFGNTLRNIGLFAGGMMLGGLLASLLGDFGGGLLGDVLGLLFNIAIFYALYKGGRYLWDRFKGNKSQNRSLNRNQGQNRVEDFKPIDITPPQASNYPAKSTIGMDYEAKRAAEYYRQL